MTEIRFPVLMGTKTEKTTIGDKSGPKTNPVHHTGGIVTRSRSNFDDGGQCRFENEILLLKDSHGRNGSFFNHVMRPSRPESTISVRDVVILHS
jgi:hypothetical protein